MRFSFNAWPSLRRCHVIHCPAVFCEAMHERGTNTEERRIQELHVDQPHQREVLLGLTLRRVIERRPGNRQQRALLVDGQVRMVAFDHAAPHFPPQGLSFLSK